MLLFSGNFRPKRLLEGRRFRGLSVWPSIAAPRPRDILFPLSSLPNLIFATTRKKDRPQSLLTLLPFKTWHRKMFICKGLHRVKDFFSLKTDPAFW